MKIDVKHTARLANLALDEKEIPKFEKQLSAILEYIQKLEEVDTSKVIPTSQTTGLENVVREDTAKDSLKAAEVFAQNKDMVNGQFKVKGIFENE